MPRPIQLKIIIKVLRKKGFLFVSQKGSHAKFRKTGNLTRTVILKMAKKEVPHGTFRSIISQSGLNESDFQKK